MPEIGAAVTADARLSPDRAKAAPAADWLAQGDIYDVQEDYVMLFDRSRTLSLNLFEHVHGESRDRGGAMVSLMETYRAAGFEPATTELPDHLPVLLEYLSTRPEAEVTDILQDAAHIFAAIEDRLTRRDSLYAPLFKALVQLSHTRPTARRWPSFWRRPMTTRPTSRRSTRSGRKPKSPSAPTPMPAARRCATCWPNGPQMPAADAKSHAAE